MLAIAAPTVVTMTSYTLMQFADAIMVSRIDGDGPYVAAQGNGGIMAWLSISFAMGLITMVNTFVSQNLGANKPERCASYAWAGLWLSGAWSLLLLPLIFLAPTVFGLMNHPEELLRLETQYAQIMLGGMVLTLAARSLANFFFGMHRPTVVMIAALSGNIVNVIANTLLIYGPAGPPEFVPFHAEIAAAAQAMNIPALGVAGAAWGTIIGSAVELVIPALLFLGPKLNKELGTRRAWRCGNKPLRDILKLGWPGGLMFANEMICWSYLMSVLLVLGGKAAGEDPTLHNTAGWIGLRYMHLSFMPAVGLSIAVTAIVGKCMGMKRPDLAAKRAWLGLAIAMVYMGLCAAAFVIFREPMIRLFIDKDMDPAQAEVLVGIGATVMIAAAVFQIFDAVAIVTSGALRGAGDTVWPGVVTLVSSWVCIVGGGHLMIALVPDLGSTGPWIAAAAYIIVLGILLMSRFLGGKWKSIDLVSGGDVSPGVVQPTPGASGAATQGDPEPVEPDPFGAR